MSEFETWRAYHRFVASVRAERRYILTAESRAFVDAVLATAPTRVETLPAGGSFWRAQRGCLFVPYYQGDEYVDDLPSPFPPERMTPLPGRAIEGRANPKGIPFLYGASHMETAIAEVRPWMGASVSVAQLRLQRGVQLVNFTAAQQGHAFYFKEPSPEKREAAVWAEIDRAFAQPVTQSDNEASYVPTQIIAEALRSAGFDGIAYRSALGPGHNIALFDLTVAAVRSCIVHSVTSIKVSSEADGAPTALYYTEAPASSSSI